jgi:hypothetical protein
MSAEYDDEDFEDYDEDFEVRYATLPCDRARSCADRPPSRAALLTHAAMSLQSDTELDAPQLPAADFDAGLDGPAAASAPPQITSSSCAEAVQRFKAVSVELTEQQRKSLQRAVVTHRLVSAAPRASNARHR